MDLVAGIVVAVVDVIQAGLEGGLELFALVEIQFHGCRCCKQKPSPLAVPAQRERYRGLAETD